MLNQKSVVREKLKQLGGHKAEVDPVDWLMGHDFGELKIGAKQGVATQVVLINQLNRLSRLGRGGPSGSRSGGKPLSPRIGNGGKQALVKLIRKGGTQTARGLRAQLRYLNREGEVEVKRSERFFGVAIDEAEQENLVASWGLDRPNETGVDKTSHFVVSFPPGTDRDDAERVGRDWADELFNSGEYGDVYDYYTVHHNDTAHPHTHVVVNRRGIENGLWLKISKRGPIDYQRLRDVQVDVARNHGIHLEATPRYARGETERTPTDVEVKRAEREDRPVERPEHTEQTATRAALAILSFAAQISGEADELRKDLPEISKNFKSIANGMREGVSIEKMLHSKQVVDLGEAKHMSEILQENRAKVVADFAKIDEQVKALPENSLDRIEIERLVSNNKSQAGRFISEFRAEKTAAERDGRYKGVSSSDDYSSNIKDEADKKIIQIAQTSGLDPDKTLVRYNSANAATRQQADNWLREEIAAAENAGFTAHQVDQAHTKIRSVYDNARNQVRAHDDNRRHIVNSVQGTDPHKDHDPNSESAQDRLQRVRGAVTPQQRERLERGDATQLSGISRDPHTQKVIAHEYLKAAIQQATPEQQVQLRQARATIDQQLEQARKLEPVSYTHLTLPTKRIV